ncbi:SDR family NAD(P)-dependent oxidoreductase [Amycolatopsis sp. NPDC059657]|uniref:SDR family NAD(P)-dependent oxidoreductase n=1 Tax=Amycolatopsis sp. NPDC059657 TaxID=3346899 RepID=UPI00366AAEEC
MKALVTGANRGIGYAVAARLGALGHTVVLGARDAELGAKAAAELRAAGHDAQHVALDVTDQASVDAAAAGLDRLDVLVNNAGISGGFAGQTPSEADPDLVRKVFDTNVFGIIRVTNAMLGLLRRSPSPRIVNVSSGIGSLAKMSGFDGPFARIPASAVYAPSKTAVNSLTVQYAKELRGILVNAADPGACATGFAKGVPYPITRTADDGAAIVVKLATLPADGPTGGYFNDEGAVPW